MRITGGIWRGRPLKSPEGQAVRPTSERAREALFDILGPSLADGDFLDLFGGSGAVGLEAASRGAPRVTVVESSPRALRIASMNLRSFDDPENVRLWKGPVAAFLDLPPRAHLHVFLDPPWDDVPRLAPVLARLTAGWLAPGARVVLEHRDGTSPPEVPAEWTFLKDYRYGDTRFSVWRAPGPP